MLVIDEQGMVVDKRVTASRSVHIEHAAMSTVRGLIVHQTGAPTAQSSLDSYKHAGANGAHFLIDTDGTIHQTASVYRQTWHVGKLRARCMLEGTCTPAEKKLNQKFSPSQENTREMAKTVPARYPSNQDSVGIELVGGTHLSDPKNPKSVVYDTVTAKQNESLHWLVTELAEALKFSLTEVFRHPTVSRKTESEASTATW